MLDRWTFVNPCSSFSIKYFLTIHSVLKLDYEAAPSSTYVVCVFGCVCVGGRGVEEELLPDSSDKLKYNTVVCHYSI